MNKKITAAFLASTFLLAACSTELASDFEVVKIGVIAPLSGDAAVYGDELQRIFDHELPLVNERLEGSGYQFELVYGDGKCAGAEATTAFQKLTDIDGVQFVIGGVCSSESLGITPLLENKNVLAVSALSSSPELIDASPNFFSFSYNDNVIGEAIGRELGQYETVAILTEQNDYNTALLGVVMDVLESDFPNTEIVFNEEFVKGGVEFRNQLQEVKASDPEVFFLNPNVGVTAEAMVRQMSELTNWEVKKVGSFAIGGESVLATGGLEGTIIVDSPVLDNSALNVKMDAIVAEKGSLDNLGLYFAAATLDVLNTLADLIVEHGENPEQVRDALAGESFEGYLGEIYFGGETYIQNMSAVRYVVEDGKLNALSL